MSVGTQSAGKPRFYAGLYVRTKKKARFWGWGNTGWGNTGWPSPALASSKWERPTPAEIERPWASLADWLRVAHSLAGTNRQTALPETNTHTESLMAPPAIEPQVIETPAILPALREKRKFRFVCDRHFIGLVYR